MGSRDDYSESFYRRHAQRYAEVSHNYIQSVYSNVSHPGLTGDADVMDRLTELVPLAPGVSTPAAAPAPATSFYSGRRVTISMGLTP